MAAPKMRLDAWQPKLQPVDTDGVLQTIVQPSKWVTVETYQNLATNQRRKNAVSGVEINDSLFAPRTANMTVANRCQSFTAADDDTYTYVYNDSDGVAAHGSTIRLKKRWGVLTHFFHEFQHIRLVDLETHLVLFTGRITSFKLKYEGSRGSIIQIKCRDVLEELNSILCKNLGASYKFTTSHRRSDIIQAMLNVGLNELASLPAGGREKFQTSPVVGTLAGTAYNLISDDNATNDTQIPYARFERSKEVLEHTIEWEPQRSGSKKLLSEIARMAVSEPHNDETADDQFGYDFYVDSNIGVENLSASQAPPPAMFNYFKRGNRLSSAGSNSNRSDPAYFGLTVKMPISNSPVAVGHKIPSGGAVYATKLMHRDFDFENPKDEIFTEAILTYEAREDTTELQTGQVATRRVIRDKKFELIYVNQLTGQFTYAGKNIDDEWKDSASVGNANSAETLDAYNIAGTKQADDVCRIQGQADTGASPSSTYKTILISDITDDFPTSNYGSDAYVVLKGSRSNSTCRFYAETAQYTEGRPSQVWSIHKAFNFTQMTIVHPDELRKEVFARLLQAQEQVRRGTYTISKAPYYWLDGKIQSITALSPKGQRITFKHDSGSAAQILSNYGIRAGMLVHKRTSDYTSIYKTNTNKDVYGYIFNMYDDSNIDVDLTESENFAVDDKIRIVIPFRAGDIIQTNNVLADVDGDHLITELTYTEWPNPMTQIESIGKNEARFGAIKKATIWTPHTKDADIEENRPGINNTMRGNQTVWSDIVFSPPTDDRINWTSGNVIIADGTTYQVVSGSTNDATYGLNGAMTGTNKYILYLDPDEENPSSNSYHIYTKISTSYKHDVDKIRIGVGFRATTGTKANIKTASSVDDDGTMGAKVDADTIVHDGSIDADLVKNNSLTGGKLADGTITGVKIGSNEIQAGNIAANQITTTHLQTDSVRTINIQADAITVNEIAADSISADQIQTDAVITDKIVANAIEAGKIAATALDTHTINLVGISGNRGKIITATGTTRNGENQYLSVGSGLLIDKFGIIAATGTGTSAVQFYIDAVDGKGYFGGGTITLDSNGLIVGTADSGARVEIKSDGIKAYDSSNALLSEISKTTGKTTITDGVFRTSAITKTGSGGSTWALSAAGIYIDCDGIFAADGTTNDDLQFYLKASDGLAYFGGGTCTIGDFGIYFPSDVDSGTGGSIQWNYSSKTTWLYRVTGSNRTRWYSNATSSSNGAMEFGNMDIIANPGGLGGNYFYNTLSLAPLYNQGSADALHSHSYAAVSHGTHGGGTVTSVNTSSPLSGSFTDSGTISHLSTAGNRHIPTGGSGSSGSRQVLTYDGSSGTATFQAASEHGTHGGGSHPDPHRLGNGSSASCTYGFSTAINTGIFRSAGGYLGLVQGGDITVEVGASDVTMNEKLKLTVVPSTAFGSELRYESQTVKYSTSTKRSKMNIRDIELDTSQIYNLKLKSFEMRNQYEDEDGNYQYGDEPERTSFGMIAEEVYDIFPQVIALDDEDLPLSVNYSLLSVLLLAELKKLRARIEVLENA